MSQYFANFKWLYGCGPFMKGLLLTGATGVAKQLIEVAYGTCDSIR